MRQSLTIFLILQLSISNSVLGQQKDTLGVQLILNEFESRLEENVAKENVGSICVAVIEGDEIIWSKQFGWIDNEQQIPASSQTVYLIGSISKSVTGLALARLVEQGIVKLDDPVEKYLPEIKNLKGSTAEYKSITLKQLAVHNSGLAREPELEKAAQGSLGEWENKVLAAISATSFISQPGENYSYSNIGYGILGLAMSRATDKSFNQLIHDLIFHPIQMKSSGFVLSPEMEKNLALSYVDTRDHNLGRGYKYPNGGVYSTIDDMVKFTKTQLHTNSINLLSDSTWALVQDFQVVIDDFTDEKYGYGLGLNIWTDNKRHKWVYHNGMVAPGYTAAMYCDLSSKFGIVILRNSDGSDDIFGIADEFLYRLAETAKD